MAHTHNIHRTQQPSLMSSIGSKVKQAAEIAGAVKGLYDTGKLIYQTVAPLIGPAVATAGLL